MRSRINEHRDTLEFPLLMLSVNSGTVYLMRSQTEGTVVYVDPAAMTSPELGSPFRGQWTDLTPFRGQIILED